MNEPSWITEQEVIHKHALEGNRQCPCIHYTLGHYSGSILNIALPFRREQLKRDKLKELARKKTCLSFIGPPLPVSTPTKTAWDSAGRPCPAGPDSRAHIKEGGGGSKGVEGDKNTHTHTHTHTHIGILLFTAAGARQLKEEGGVVWCGVVCVCVCVCGGQECLGRRGLCVV